jgi:ERCC4-type nuclease
MVILHTGNEQKNNHILEEFDNQKILHEEKALKTGDYTFKIKACPELGFDRDTYFIDELCIERKNSISELAGNLAGANKEDDRIFKELNRMINIERVYLVIEDDCLDDIFAHKYRSNYNPDSYIRTLLTWQARNNMHVYFIKKENMARMIYELCKNCLDSKILK